MLVKIEEGLFSLYIIIKLIHLILEALAHCLATLASSF